MKVIIYGIGKHPVKKGTAVVEVQYQDYHRATLISTVSARASVTVNNQPPQLRIIPDDATITTVQSLQLIASPLDGNSQIDPDGDEVTFVWEIEGIGQLQFGDEIIEEGENHIVRNKSTGHIHSAISARCTRSSNYRNSANRWYYVDCFMDCA